MYDGGIANFVERPAFPRRGLAGRASGVRGALSWFVYAKYPRELLGLVENDGATTRFVGVFT